MTGPSADDLTDAQVAAIIAAGDETAMLHDELRARGPAASADKAGQLAEWSAAVGDHPRRLRRGRARREAG